MVVLMNAGSVPSQLSNFFFLASGLFYDLLIIRLCLTLAYLFLFISSLLGIPGWGESLSTGRMALDLVLWSAVNLFLVHGSSFLRLVYDERHIELPSEEHEMLWRYFYRHSGLSRVQFEALILPHLKLVVFSEGESIPCKDNFYMILDGTVVCNIYHESAPGQPQRLRLASGDMFPLRHISQNYTPRMSVFHKTVVFNPSAESTLCRAFSISRTQLEAMAVHPHARDAWTALLIATLAEIAEQKYTKEGVVVDLEANANQGSARGGSVVLDSSRHSDSIATSSLYHPLFGPLDPSEEPDPLLAGGGGGFSKPLQHIGRYLKLTAFLPWPCGTFPSGLRHSLRQPTEPERYKRNSTWKKAYFEDKNYS
jgi:hypothetical protein